LAEKGIPLPKATSTGTTIVGCLFKDGIVLGADTRATEGDIVADKNCEKVMHTASPNDQNMICFVDTLYYGKYPMLWSGDGSRYRIYHSLDILKHGVACPLDGQKTSRRDGNDYAQADALSFIRIANVAL
jgi:hypothetical protein